MSSSAVRLASLDLNLLPVLDALLEEASVTQAARRLQLSQPAVSASLGKLRRHFDDELLQRRGNTYLLTPLALHLKRPTRLALDSVKKVFSSEPLFDAARAQREFTLLASDYAMAVLGEPLSALLTAAGPDLRLRLRQHGESIADNAREALRHVDGLLFPHGFLTGFGHTDLYQDEWVCLVATTNTRVQDELSMELLAELPWVFTYDAPTAFIPAARQLQMLGVTPSVQIVVESFLALPALLVGSDRIALVQRTLAPHLCAGWDVRTLPCPFTAVPLVEALWWDPMNENDAAHAWLRQLLQAAGRLIAPVSAEAAASVAALHEAYTAENGS